MNMFRTLNADEIDCRIAQIKRTANGAGLSLLLYKDARCDQNILDETVGAFNWKREHTRDNRNCIVSLWDAEKQQWVSKEDTGTESNTEKEKGLASDSFKRACFNWGIGRELYTAPFIWIGGSDCNIREKDGRLACYDRFTVDGIGYKNGVIIGLRIKNQNTGKICYSWGEIQQNAPEKPEQPDTEPDTYNNAPETQTARNAASAPRNADVSTAPKLPPEAAPKKQPAPELSAVQRYLLSAMKELREARGISAAQNNKLFKEQRQALINAGLAPNKALEEYTIEEAHALIDAMYANFTPEGTEIKK